VAQAIVDALTATLPGNFGTFNIRSDTPTPENQDKLWYRVDASCNPLGWYIYSGGAWVRATPIGTPPGMLAPFYLSTFTGVLAEDRAIVSFIDTGDTYPGGGSTTLHTDPFWLLCDGVATAYGTPPDLQGRDVIGAGAGSGLTTRAYDATGGAETHRLITSELAAHQHAVPTGCQPSQTSATAVTFDPFGNEANPYTPQRIATASPAEFSVLALTKSTGGGGAHNNMQPFRALYWAWRTSRTI
jgi:microcystin-dependent protein